MKVEVKKIDSTKRELRFEIPKEKVKQTFEEVYEEIGKFAKIKGFRPGKIPRNILENHYAHTAREEVIKKLIPEVYQEAVKKENIEPLDLPEIHEVNFKDGLMTFLAKLEVKPEVKVQDYKGMKVIRKNSQVSDEELNKTLEFFKKGQGAEKEMVLDDTFARGLGYPSLAEFKMTLKRQLELDKDRHNRVDVENQIVEELLKKSKLAVPGSLVKKQLEQRVAEAKNRLKSQGLAEEEINRSSGHNSCSRFFVEE